MKHQPRAHQRAEHQVEYSWFARAARKAKVTDSELFLAVSQVLQQQADDLGGGVFKKRLNNNLYRSIVLAKAGRHWIFAYLFAKSDRGNITPNELVAFRKLADNYPGTSNAGITLLLKNKDLLEICHDYKTCESQANERCV